VTDPAALGLRRAGVWAMVAAGWAAFAPLGLKYLAVLGLAATSALWLHRSGGWPTLARQTTIRVAVAFWLLVLASLAWTTGPGAIAASQCGLYALLMAVPVIAHGCPPALAARALRHYAAASAVVGSAIVLHRAGVLPEHAWGHSSVWAEGNQRIATSLVLALGAAVASALALQAHLRARDGGNHRGTIIWTLAAVLAVLGLSLQDRRTGMLALPVLLAVLGLAHLRRPRQRVAAVLAVLLLSLAAWQFAPGVRGRIDEGLNEVRTYQSSDTTATSWGMRLRLAEHTLDMIRERLLFGHGVGSWITQWRQRVQPGLLISIHTTPHNEYLLVTSQLGIVGLIALLGVLAAHLRAAWRAGPAGYPALMAWSAIACTGMFNVVLRDAKFALPMLLVAGLGGAVARARHPA